MLVKLARLMLLHMTTYSPLILYFLRTSTSTPKQKTAESKRERHLASFFFISMSRIQKKSADGFFPIFYRDYIRFQINLAGDFFFLPAMSDPSQWTIWAFSSLSKNHFSVLYCERSVNFLLPGSNTGNLYLCTFLPPQDKNLIFFVNAMRLR